MVIAVFSLLMSLQQLEWMRAALSRLVTSFAVDFEPMLQVDLKTNKHTYRVGNSAKRPYRLWSVGTLDYALQCFLSW